MSFGLTNLSVAEKTMRTPAIISTVVGMVLSGKFEILRADPGTQTQGERIARLIGQLGDLNFAKREAASKELDPIGEPALGALRKAASHDDPEVLSRAERVSQAVVGRMRAAAAKT